ncbi:hypothetical protein PSU4_27590 [Pseudonocardia sulfidoxydans NBRC 16205]|uniref:DUF1648 domain-containing protein n=1 Tax=Pseudonocardia sulfidoxydans NBRC 16205 TaxID=1223511 RepID=A0A511DG93_9PSEU|nr:hypothetical protein [Pseudonocardia sulfidoxydans]GEL23805.1 hypothetical protein PSU4_27590 [Pseudonocardia sulfidoxydans NBRC 16205]
MGRTARALLTGAPHLVAVTPALVTALVAADRMPAEPATRFTFDGTAVSTMPHAALVATIVALGVVLAFVFGAMGARPTAARVSSFDTARFFGAVSWATAGLLGGVLYEATAANVDVASAAEAHLTADRLLIAVGVAVVAGVVGYLVTPSAPPAPEEPPGAPVPIGATERVSWSRRIESRMSLALGAVVLVGGLVLGWLAGWLPGALLIVVGLAVLLLGSSALVTVDRRGLVVALGALGWPRLRVPVDDIASVTAGDVSPAQFGGWGYRLTPGGSGVVLRSGPAVIVTRRSGRRFTVTVDDARTAAGLLTSLVHEVS